MDNASTGRLIRELRRERNLTQRELAAQLHVTDRAVSKWERGLCAPDIALLEPLSAALGCSVLELIAGERSTPNEARVQGEAGARSALDYSLCGRRQRLRLTRRRSACAIAACLAGLLLAAAFLLWKNGTLILLDRNVSPDGNKTISVYRKALSGGGFSLEDATALIVTLGDGASWRINYGDCRYGGSWWAPDSERYVLALEYEDGVSLVLADLTRNAERNLDAYLTMGVEATEVGRYGYAALRDGWPEIEYRFLQWGRDGASMLIYYSYEDEARQTRDGYFWYDWERGTVEAVLALSQ